MCDKVNFIKNALEFILSTPVDERPWNLKKGMTEGYMAFVKDIYELYCTSEDKSGKVGAISTWVNLLKHLNPLFVKAALKYEGICLNAPQQSSYALREVYTIQETDSGEALFVGDVGDIISLTDFHLTVKEKTEIDNACKGDSERSYMIFNSMIIELCIKIGQDELKSPELTKGGRKSIKDLSSSQQKKADAEEEENAVTWKRRRASKNKGNNVNLCTVYF